MSETFSRQRDDGTGVCRACFDRTGYNNPLVPVYRKFIGGNWYCKDPACIEDRNKEALKTIKKFNLNVN